MPPSIPTSLNFEPNSSSIAPRVAAGALLRWPKNVIGFLTGFVGRRGNNNNTNGANNNSISSPLSTIHSPQRGGASRKASRADTYDPHAGIRFAAMDIGLNEAEEVLGGGGATTTANSDATNGAFINATEQVVSSVRVILKKMQRDYATQAASSSYTKPSSSPLAFGSSPSHSSSLSSSPRILLFGRHAEFRSHYFSHSCGFGVESGNTPEDCTWSLLDSDGDVQLRNGEGVHWSEDLTELDQLPSNSFDIILAFDIQLDPRDMTAASVNSSSNGGRSLNDGPALVTKPTPRWMAKMMSVLKEGGVFAGIACLEDSPSGSSSTATTTNNSSAFASGNGSPRASPSFHASTSDPLSSPISSPIPFSSSNFSSAAPSCPFATLRLFRDRVETLGFFMHTAVDLSLEGRTTWQMDEEENAINGTLSSPITVTQPDLLLARFLATKNRTQLTFSSSSVPIRRASSRGSLSLARSNSGSAIGLTAAAAAGGHSPFSRETPPSTGRILRPPNIHLSVATGLEHPGVSASPPALNLPHLASYPTASAGSDRSNTSSATPSPKLSPSTSMGDMMSIVALNGVNPQQHHQQMMLGSMSGLSIVAAAAHRRHSSNSSRSSPSMSPLTPSYSSTGYILNPLEPIVVSGVSMGLPNAFRETGEIFSKLNIDKLFAGENFIGQLSKEEKQDMVDMKASQISKDKVTGARIKNYLKDDSQLIQVLSKMNPRSTWGLSKQYSLPSHVMEVLDATYELAICAGLEALKDAGFANLKLQSENPDEIGLPESMRDETGVIFASSFPCLDSIIQEVTKKVRAETADQLCAQLGVERPKEKEYAYEYDRKLLFKLLVMANCQLAELIKARGPNMHINTACSGTTQAIATAEDWMKVGRCKRVIVISADVATNETCLKYLSTGFLALGAASILPDPVTAAAPFDARRKGMILGAGSVGLVLEYATSCLARGSTPKCELVGSHMGNSAFHATLMDAVSISQQLNIFLKRIEHEKGINIMSSQSTAAEFTKDLIYYSHETNTSANGGCAKVEMDALASIWSDSGNMTAARKQILITNTKGHTGHPMAVGFEDVMAVESLQRGLIPPVANFKTLDSRLAPLIDESQLSRGGSHSRSYVLRFAGGFGNQFVYVMYRKWTEQQQANWMARLHASTLAGGVGSHHVANAIQKQWGYYSIPLQVSSQPNSVCVSPFLTSASATPTNFGSRTNSESNLRELSYPIIQPPSHLSLPSPLLSPNASPPPPSQSPQP